MRAGLGPQLTLALDRKVEAMSDALWRLIGCREDEIVGRSVVSVVIPEDMESLVAAHPPVLPGWPHHSDRRIVVGRS
jgi:hypothetical protein